MNSAQVYAICLLTNLIAVASSRARMDYTFPNVTEVQVLNFTQRVILHGYLSTKHIVQTEDGHLLTLFRLKRPNVTRKRPILLMHGLLLTASMWIDAGPNIALAYLLADAGHDVWLGNVRGSYYSRKHVWLNPDTNQQYWQFCTDEIGYYDLPAFIDHILLNTGVPKINYIGYSQGCGTFFIMCSERPEYCDKVNLMVALAPSTRHLLTRSELFYRVTKFYQLNEEIFTGYGIWEVFPKGGLIQSFTKSFCAVSVETTTLCRALIDILDGANPESRTISSIRSLMTYSPGGTSVHNMAKFGQSCTSKSMRKFNYGVEGNLKRYGSKTSPIYNLSAVIVPTVVIYGRNDGLVDVRDVKWVLGKLPNVIEAYEVRDILWSHIDFILNKNIPLLLLPKIKEYL